MSRDMGPRNSKGCAGDGGVWSGWSSENILSPPTTHTHTHTHTQWGLWEGPEMDIIEGVLGEGRLP